MVAKDPSRTMVTESMNPYEKPPSMGVQQSLKTFLYNRETGAFIGRTPSSWGKILLFYLVFYGVLAALVSICWLVFYHTLDKRIPRWQLDSSIIGTNPGLGFRPKPSSDNVESTLIRFKATDLDSVMPWVNETSKFLKDYREPGSLPGRGDNTNDCSYDKPPRRGQVCIQSIDHIDPCIKSNLYNFHKSAPCIFLKLNKIYGWVPEYYNDTVGLPEKMPRYLKDVIADKKAKRPAELNTIWVSCEGENPADVENIGPVNYLPQQGFPGYFYPYENPIGYLSPLVAVYFERPQTGVLINVECKAWARNIKHGRNDKMGSVHFELLID